MSVAQSSAVFDKFEEEIGAAEGPLCIGVLYRFDMTNFRKGELMVPSLSL